MNNIKKFTLSLLTSAIVLAGPFTIINADEDAKTTEVTYTLGESYEWSIPAEITLEGTTAKKYGEITATNVHLLPGHKLQIVSWADNSASLKNQSNTSKVAMFNIGNDAQLSNSYLFDNKVILDIPYDYKTTGSTPTKMSADVYAKLSNEVRIAGTYKETLKFIASVIDMA